MNKFIKIILINMILTLLILTSYTILPKILNYQHVNHFFGFLNEDESRLEKGIRRGIKEIEEEGQTSTVQERDGYRAVWISYQEFNAYRISEEENNSRNFRQFYKSILDRCDELGITTLIVQVRPYADAMYPSDYFPWSAYISDGQGQDPGYDPLQIMVEETHNYNMRFEAWINPFRISYSDLIEGLCEGNIARKWAKSDDKNRNVLTYDGALYFNPSTKDVQDLIVNGVKEVLDNYNVDGIHMDDYFYPEFTEDNYNKEFDVTEYEQYAASSDEPLSLTDWRREQINSLVKRLYKTVHAAGKRFGISPAGNLDNLRSDYAYYVDIDRWMNQEGYVDYIMPQLYWGFSNELAPFADVLERWKSLAKDSNVDLYIGLQLYKIGSEDSAQTDYEELQSSDFLKEQITYLQNEEIVKGYSLFSYQYLDPCNERYHFDTSDFSEDRKELLLENAKCLQ